MRSLSSGFPNPPARAPISVFQLNRPFFLSSPCFLLFLPSFGRALFLLVASLLIILLLDAFACAARIPPVVARCSCTISASSPRPSSHPPRRTRPERHPVCTQRHKPQSYHRGQTKRPDQVNEGKTKNERKKHLDSSAVRRGTRWCWCVNLAHSSSNSFAPTNINPSFS